MSRRGTNIRKRTDGRWEGRYYIVDTAGSKSVSEILGHSNVNITLNRYVHPNLETKRSAINSIVIP